MVIDFVIVIISSMIAIVIVMTIIVIATSINYYYDCYCDAGLKLDQMKAVRREGKR